MKIIAIIPIKQISRRVPGKNFKLFCGIPLYKYIISNTINSKSFDEIYIDTDSEEIKDYALSLNLKIIHRPKELTSDSVNGNDLIVKGYEKINLQADIIFQLFATAPLLSHKTIKSCVNEFTSKADEYDSCFTVTEENGWFWFNSQPINYLPNILPRSQDAPNLTKESTGLYAITEKALLKYKSRIGARPLMYKIPEIESLDIDTDFEFEFAEFTAKNLKEKTKIL